MTDPATPSERPADGSGEDAKMCGDSSHAHFRAWLDRATPADPERRSVTVETLRTALRPVTRSLTIAGGDKGYEKWLTDTAERILAAIPQDATPAGLDVRRLAVAMSHVEMRTMASPTEPGPQTWADARAIAAAYAATDPEAEGLDVERVRRAFWLIQSWPPDRDSAEVFAEAYLAATDPEETR